ncbi:YggS family pyridoxal phosphate-dependent enzyme [Oceanobacillus saliphilus]|uniref:YggS family pyridoxal phosphate-dependent enzyme n=1 Tax=Oceanobacillus saliphilus TaxID=2925834 RepID=UPI00201DB381|nr:YggS family pyridoxal phosphate-dependent enzyme [Oceanobacillus saliphilus]
MEVAANLEWIQEKIGQACARSGRNPDDITIIGVTKYVTIERTKEAIDAGVKNLGENRNEGFLEKHSHIGNQAKWHFIGSLQSRKVKDIIDKIDALHSLDRMSLANEINKRATVPIDCFVQVNVSGEESKHGLEPEEVIPFIEKVEQYAHIRVVGLMTMAPHIDDPDQIRKVFRNLAQLRDRIRGKNWTHAPCEYLSMGMSNDYEIAVEEGATHIRIGSKLVGS